MPHLFKPIDRRTFLRGLGGAAIALPALESMAMPSAAPAVPKRMVCAGVYFGLMPVFFHPKEIGTNYTMPRLLKPLEGHRNDFTVFSGLDHNIGGGHSATKYFLSGVPLEQAPAFVDGNVSVDQKAAEHVGGVTRYPSLSLGCETSEENRLSWTRHSSPIRPIEKASELFDLLFLDPGEERKAKERSAISENQSILDVVRGSADRFKWQLSKKDTEKLDQYYTSIREFEKKAAQSSEWIDRKKPKSEYRLHRDVDALDLKERVSFFYDLMVLALQTDSTRAISLSFAGLGGNNGGFRDVTRGYHTLSHHGKADDAIEELATIETFYIAEFSRFLGKLKSIEELNGKTLLDNTMCLFGCGMSNANSHSNRDLPVLLAGGGFRHGEHKHYAREANTSVSLCNLYASMLQQFGLETDQFNASTGTLTGLEAT